MKSFNQIFDKINLAIAKAIDYAAINEREIYQWKDNVFINNIESNEPNYLLAWLAGAELIPNIYYYDRKKSEECFEYFECYIESDCFNLYLRLKSIWRLVTLQSIWQLITNNDRAVSSDPNCEEIPF